MAKPVITDPELLHAEAYPKGTWPAVLEACDEDWGPWGEKHPPQVQRFTWRVRFVPSDETPEEMHDQSLSRMTPCVEGRDGEPFFRFVNGLGSSLADFDSDNIPPQDGSQIHVYATISCRPNRHGVPENRIEQIVLVPDAV